MKPRGNGSFSHRRLARERKTVRAMIGIYCRDLHRTGEGLCADCRELVAYAARRLASCPFGGEKNTCGTCTVHCYNRAMRVKIKDVMRHSDPKMIVHHPVLALRHLIDERRAAGGLRRTSRPNPNRGDDP